MKYNYKKPIKRISYKTKVGKKNNNLYIRAVYYNDHSGHYVATFKNRQLLCNESGTAKDQMEWLELTIEDTKLELQAMQEIYKVLNSEIKKFPKPVKA